VLQGGKVVEEGKHDDLMTSRKHYFELWKQQFPMLQDVM